MKTGTVLALAAVAAIAAYVLLGPRCEGFQSNPKASWGGAAGGMWWWSRREDNSKVTSNAPMPPYVPAAVQEVVTSPPPTKTPERPKLCGIRGGTGPGACTPPKKKPKQPNSGGGDGGGDSGSGKFSEFLRKLNELRAKHDAPPVEWDTKLAAYAQDWSSRCCSKDLVHSGGQYGENLALGWWASPEESAMQSLMMWYNERDSIKPNTDPEEYYGLAGHFTPLVWVKTRRVGLGTFKRQDGAMIVTASFDPPGNYRGEFAKNVLKVQA